MSNFVVSARKYRPIRFDDVVGQQHVSQTLKNALQNDHLAHAFLFCGPRGVGKTTCARILAKVLNCTNRTEDFEACNQCSSCKAFNENASFNITELDAASNNSVEHIRTLVEQVRFQPQQGDYKVFIIDEVHMLSQSAFNAFLKTLEEPPPYAIFILATTEKHKIIPTILSRCQIFDFKRIQVQDMVTHLQDICKKEGIEADKSALHIIAQKADGALRDALSIFDRIVSSSGKKITYEDVITNLNVLDYDYFFKMTDALLAEDLPNLMLVFDEIQKNGFEGDSFINGLAEHFRNLLVCQDNQTLQLLEVSDNLKDQYQKQANLTPASFLLTALNIANDCDINFKMAHNKRLHVEMALIKIAYINRAIELAHAPASEKKTPEPIAVDPSPPLSKKKEKNSENKPAETSSGVKESITEVSVQSSANQEESLINPKVPSKKAPSPVLATSGKHGTFKIPTLDEIKSQVHEDDIKNGEKESKFNNANLKEAWTAYINTVSSPSVKNVLKNAELMIEKDQSVIVAVGTQMAKGMIQEEFDLMVYLRKELHHPKLALEIKIDPSKTPVEKKPKPQKLTSPKDKYDKLKEINPLVDELRRRFDLKMDKD